MECLVFARKMSSIVLNDPPKFSKLDRSYQEFDIQDPKEDQISKIAEKIDDNDCSEGSFIGGLIGAGIALSSSRGKDRFWAVPAGGTAGALIGCQVDGG